MIFSAVIIVNILAVTCNILVLGKNLKESDSLEF